MAEDLELHTPYLRLAARAWGPTDGVPVLALHGWLDNAASFDGLGPLLSGCRLVALDLVGHGRSDWRPPGTHYHVVDYIGDVLAAADCLGWERFSLLGHSLGAGVASLAAGTVPGRIRRLALIEGLGPLTHSAAENPAALETAIAQMRHLPRKRLPVYPDLKAAVSARERAGGLSRAAAHTLTARSVKPVDGGLSWRSDPRLTFRSPLYLMEIQVLAFLSRIQAPTLLINGEAGYLADRPVMAQRYDRVADLRLSWLPGGHHLHLENPESVARLLNQFLVSNEMLPGQ